RRVERNAINPRRQRGVAAEGINLPIHLHQDVLRHLFSILVVLQVTKRELLDPRAVGSSQLGNRVAVPGAHAADQIAFGCLLTHLWPPSRKQTPDAKRLFHHEPAELEAAKFRLDRYLRGKPEGRG